MTLTDLLTELDQKAPGVRAVVGAWPTLPEALRAGIVAMVRASMGER